jgi:predicted metalloprotease
MLRCLKIALCTGAVLGAGAMLAAAIPSAMAQTDDERRQAKIQAMISDAWDDATTTWQGILGESAYRSDAPKINFVAAVRASHCYGLYIGTGPVYCSGNTTVFVSVASMNDLDKRIPGVGDAGLAFLVAHELGHHIQNISGRFRVLNQLVRNDPTRQRELALRFELEADCLAGVWAGKSPKFAATEDARTGIIASIDAIGDDRILAASGTTVDPAQFTHGSSQQRVHWFRTGLQGGSMEACNVLQAETF